MCHIEDRSSTSIFWGHLPIECQCLIFLQLKHVFFWVYFLPSFESVIQNFSLILCISFMLHYKTGVFSAKLLVIFPPWHILYENIIQENPFFDALLQWTTAPKHWLENYLFGYWNETASSMWQFASSRIRNLWVKCVTMWMTKNFKELLYSKTEMQYMWSNNSFQP
jgi:hypothetical protein